MVKFADCIDTKAEEYRPAYAANLCCQLLLLTCDASFGCQLVYDANLCCQLGKLAIAGFEPWTAAL